MFDNQRFPAKKLITFRKGAVIKLTLTIVKRFNGRGREIDETYQPVIPELIELLSEVYQKLNAAGNAEKSNDISA